MPRGLRRQAHEDAFGAPAGFEAEPGAPVQRQVELGVAAAAHQLPVLLAGGVGPVAVLAHEGGVSPAVHFAHILHKSK